MSILAYVSRWRRLEPVEEPTGNPLITTAELAALRGVSTRTIIRQAERGDLPVAAKAPGIRGAYLFDRAAVEALATRKSVAA